MLSNLRQDISREVGLVINWKFHSSGKWVSSFTPALVNAIVKNYNPVIIQSQLDYFLYGRKLKLIISMEPGWAAPKIKFTSRSHQRTCMLLSDPHSKTSWLRKYIDKYNVDLVLSQYYHPFYYHFPDFPLDRFVHFPWAVADEFVHSGEIIANGDQVVAFGGKGSDAYDVRNWCKRQDGVTSADNSGVENKVFSDEEYFRWLSSLGAAIAAGSSDPKYDLVTPKYLEIMSSGSLLLGQFCKDLELLGVKDGLNAVLFDQSGFLDKLNSYKNNPGSYLAVREAGRELISERHLVSHRIKTLVALMD